MRAILAAFLAAGALAAVNAEPAQPAAPASGGQTIIGKGMLNPDAPIELSADDMSADQKTGMVVYTGNVVVRQGEVRMRANQMRAKLVGTKPTHIYATGRVVIDAPSGIATGDAGVYEVGPRIVTLTGHVVLTKDQNVMRGQQLVVNLISGQANLDGGQGKGGRVQALFTPNDGQPKQKP